MIPINIALCADTVYKSGVGMLPNNRIEECFDFGESKCNEKPGHS